MKKTLLGDPLPEKAKLTVWGDVENWVELKVDHTHPLMSSSRNGEIYVQVHMLFTALKVEHAEWVKPFVALTLPTVDPLAQSDLSPEGINTSQFGPLGPAVAKITASMLQEFLVSMEDSDAVRVMENPELMPGRAKELLAKEKKEKAAAKKKMMEEKRKNDKATKARQQAVAGRLAMTKRGTVRKTLASSENKHKVQAPPKKTAKGKAKAKAQAAPEESAHPMYVSDDVEAEPKPTEEDKKKNGLYHITAFLKYLKDHVNPDITEATLHAYRLTLLKAGLTDDIRLTVNGQEHVQS